MSISHILLVSAFASGCVVSAVIIAVVLAVKNREFLRDAGERKNTMDAISVQCSAIENAFTDHEMGIDQGGSLKISVLPKLHDLKTELQRNAGLLDHHYVKYVEYFILDKHQCLLRESRQGAGTLGPAVLGSAPVGPFVPSSVETAPLVAERARQEEARKAKEEEARKAKEEEARKAKQEEARKAKEEEARKAKQEEDRKAKEEEARKAKQEEARRAKEEEARKAKEEEARKAKQEEDRKAKQEQARKAKEEEDRKAKEEEARKAKEEEACKAKEEQARKAKEEEARKAKEEQARKAKEEEARKAKEEEARKTSGAESSTTAAIDAIFEPDTAATVAISLNDLRAAAKGEEPSGVGAALPEEMLDIEATQEFNVDELFGRGSADAARDKVTGVGDSTQNVVAADQRQKVDQPGSATQSSEEDDDTLVTGDDLVEKMDNLFGFDK